VAEVVRFVRGEGVEETAFLEGLVPVQGGEAPAELEVAGGVVDLEADEPLARLEASRAKRAPVRGAR